MANPRDDVIVRFRFKDNEKIFRAAMTKKQYDNFKILPTIEECDIVEKLGIEIPKEKEEELRKRLQVALKNDTSHVKKLSYD